jgi:DNA-binding transcriptional LysR family regulator
MAIGRRDLDLFREGMSVDRLAAMQTFVTVVDAGSFSGAARRLNVGQPAVSKSIAQVEDRLGVKLLVRSTRGLAPTEAGLNFYERARRAIEEADEAEQAARGAGAGLSGKLRICAPVTFARLHLMPRIREFLADHPGLDMEIVLDDRNIDLVQEGIDVGLRMGLLADSSLVARKIATGPRRVFGTAAYFDRAGVPSAPGDLASHEAIIYTQEIGEVWSFRRGDAVLAVAMRGRLRVTAAEGVRAAVLAEAGFAVTSEWMFSPELANGTVKAVLTDWELPTVDLWAVFPTGRTATTKVRTFISFVEDLMASRPQAATVAAVSIAGSMSSGSGRRV